MEGMGPMGRNLIGKHPGGLPKTVGWVPSSVVRQGRAIHLLRDGEARVRRVYEGKAQRVYLIEKRNSEDRRPEEFDPGDDLDALGPSPGNPECRYPRQNGTQRSNLDENTIAL